ncbi:MAG TPA: hypothetical protein VNT33_05545, partial [Telluria sp.]|nr:hypothetical protein [Telluria sp.]
MKRLVAGALLAIAANAIASGDYGPNYTMFKAYRSPDIPLDRFQAGELGILQPGMLRVYLYTGWRSMMLGPSISRNPGTDHGLARADGSAFGYGWSHGDSRHDELLRAAATALKLPPDGFEARRVLACPEAASTFALETMKQLAARPDATRERVDAWLRAQYQVGEACEQEEDARYAFGPRKLPKTQPPALLGETEPMVWRQAREYQLAAWQFYIGHYGDSTPLFERIGATPGHPMQGLGKYLALRSEIRRYAASAKENTLDRREEQARALEQRADAIIKDKSLQAMHEPTRALLRSMRAALTPETQLAELSRYLDNPASDPYALDRLGDWSILFDGADRNKLRGDYRFIDWIETLRECDAARKQDGCKGAARHAQDRWHKSGERPWLVAALMLSEALTPDLERAALAIAPADPAYLTAQYHLARLYRLAGMNDAARAISDSALRRELSPGTRNLFREERFAVATSFQDAANHLLRTNVDLARHSPQKEEMLNDDALIWIGRLP